MKTITMPLDEYNSIKNKETTEGYNAGWKAASLNIINGLWNELYRDQPWKYPDDEKLSEKLYEVINKIRTTRNEIL